MYKFTLADAIVLTSEKGVGTKVALSFPTDATLAPIR